jgi:hypothetical protein
MADGGPEGSQKAASPAQEELRSERWIKKIKNHPVVAAFIVAGTLVLGVLTFTNTLHDEWEKVLSWLHPQEPPDAYAARVDVLMQDDYPMFWIIRDWTKPVACPAMIQMTISITNLQTFPATLAEYTVEVLDANDHWVTLPHITLGAGDQVYVSLVKNSTSVTLEDLEPRPLDQQLTAANFLLQPHIPLRGFMFFNDPLRYAFHHVRVKLRDTLGVQFISKPLWPEVGDVQGTQFTRESKELNLTDYHIDYHCGR